MTTQSQVRLHMRWIIRDDLPAVLEIEQHQGEHGWTEETFRARLRQRNCIGMVVEHQGRVVGFVVYELHDTCLHLLNIAVLPTHRRIGIGGQMVQKLINKLSSHRRNKIVHAVRESDLPAQLFFRAQGFRATTVLRNGYEDSGEDAYLMSRYLHEDAQ